MADNEVVAPVAAADLKRKIDDLETEALEHAEGMRDDVAKNGDEGEKNSDDVAGTDGSEAKRPRLDESEKPDGLANANGLKEEKSDEDVEQQTKDTTEEEEQETMEVKTEQNSSVEEHISLDSQQISVKEETKEVLINTEEASIDVKEETKEVTIKEEETVEPTAEEPQQEIDNFKLDEPSSTDSSTMSRKIEVPNNKVGVLIGKAGDTIRYLQYNSGAKIQITRDADADTHAATRPVEIIGTLSNIDKAEKLINAVIAEADAGGSPALVARGLATAQAAGAGEQVEIKVPNEKVGLIIGRGGETIKGLQTRSGARIQLIPQHLPEGDGSKERIVRVSGDMRQIEAAQEMIKEVLSQTVRPSPLSGGFNQHAYRPRGPTGPPQWGPRGSHPAQMGYDHPHRGPYPSQNPQYSHPSYGNYPPQQMGPRSNFGAPPSMQGGASGYDYYGGQGGHASNRPVSGSHSTSMPGHPSVPSQAPAGGPPPSHSNYNYGQPHGPEYGHQQPYSQTAAQQGYGHGYDDNHAPVHHPYGGHSNSHSIYSQGGLQPGYHQQQQYGKPPYGMPTQGTQPQSYGPRRPGQPGDIPYQSQVPATQSYGTNVPHQQQYPYATSGAAQQTYPSYGSAPATDGYNQPPPASGPGYSQQAGQSVPSYPQSAGQQAPAYGQVAPTAGYAQYTNTQQVYPEQPATSNAGYGYQGAQDPSYGSSASGSAYAAPAIGQPGYAQPSATQPSYDQSASQSTAYGVAQGTAAVGYGKTVSPQPGYPQYDSSQMYAAPH